MWLPRLMVQTVLLALAQIWANKVRAMLTTLGIIIAVAAVVSVVGAMQGFQTFLLDQFATLGANKVWVFPRRPPEQRERFSFRQIRLTIDQIDSLMPHAPSLAAITPVMEMGLPVQHADRVRQFVSVHGVRPSWFDIEDRAVLNGRPLMQIDEDDRRQVCLINDKGVGELALDTDPVGQVLLVGGRRFVIVGVLETKQVSPMFGGDESETELFVPFRTGEMMRPEPRLYAIAKTKAPELFDDAKAEITAQMRRVRNLKPEDPNTFGVEAIEQAIAQIKSVLGGATVMLAGLVGIALLVGGIGIMNIMLVSVSERTREIGLRKAVGARPEVILLQFLVEAVTLCMMGCLVGLLLGFGAVGAMRLTGASAVAKASVPFWAIMLAGGFSIGTGVIFGMFPAIKAARLNPIEALRHE